MAHIEKCKASAAVALILHDERKQGLKDEHIDPKLSHLNYNLCDRPGGSINYMNRRIDEIMNGKKPRKDAVKLVSTIVTVPKNLPIRETGKFMQAVFEFIAKEYGKENIVSAWVHNDEPGARPHIHIKAVPAITDERTGKTRLSAKDKITRAYLKTFHNRLQTHVEKALGHEVEIINGATAGKNREINEYKAEEAKKVLQDYQRQLASVSVEFESKKAYLEQIEREHESISENVKEKKSITGKVKTVEMPAEKWERHAMTFMDREAVKHMKKRLEATIKDFQNSVAGQEHKTMVADLENLREYAQELETAVETVNEFFTDNPELYQRYVDFVQQPSVNVDNGAAGNHNVGR